MIAIEAFFDTPYFVVDILPEQVPADRAKRFFEVEKYFMTPERFARIREKFADIILKLYCYHDIIMFVGYGADAVLCPAPEDIAEEIAKNSDDLRFLIGDGEALAAINKDDLFFTVYGAKEDAERLITSVALSEGLFVRRPDGEI